MLFNLLVKRTNQRRDETTRPVLLTINYMTLKELPRDNTQTIIVKTHEFEGARA